jgi:hypothetical protein
MLCFYSLFISLTPWIEKDGLIASDVSLLVTFNQAIDGVIQNNQKARQNPKALAQLNGAVPELCVITIGRYWYLFKRLTAVC